MIREQVEPAEEEPVKKPRRRRKRRASSGLDLGETFNYWFTYPIILGALVAIGLLGIGVAFLWHPAILFTLALGAIMLVTGYIWMIVAAFQYDSYGGFILLVSLTVGFNLIGILLFLYALREGHIDLGTLAKPFLVLIVGLALGGAAIGLIAGTHWFAPVGAG